MSCLIQKPENTAAIADFIAELANVGYNGNGIVLPSVLHRELVNLGCYKDGWFEPKLIYMALTALNYNAYEGRYPDNGKVYPVPYKENNIRKMVVWDNGRYKIEKWHYRMLKMIQFFNYQCEEEATYNTDLHKGMQDLENTLALFIIQNSAIYKGLRWE